MPDILTGKDPDELTLLIENREVVIESAKFLRTMDTCADALNCTMPWEPGLDPVVDELTKFKKFPNCFVYLGGKLQMTGVLYNITQRRNNAGTVKELEIYTQTANMIDSTVRPPFEENNIDLYQRCINQAVEFGIQVVKDEALNVGGKFSRVTANQTDLCFNHLKELAWQRGCLLSCTEYGELEIILPNVDGQPVGTLEEGDAKTETYEITFSGRARFQEYDAITTSAQKTRTKIKQQAVDQTIIQPRFITFTADECLPGEGLNAALWHRNKTAAEALTMQFPVNSWYNPQGTLWGANQLVTVKSEALGIKKGFTYLISQVEFNYSNSGSTAILSLKVPNTYALLQELNEPWN